ncbi:unnamed protein product [Ectocarpus sp. 8 AP-2014]
MMSGQTKSYLSAVILLIAAAIQQADAFMVAPAAAGKVSAGNKVEARGDFFKLNQSPYEEYMASRGGGNSAPAPAAPAAPSSPARSAVSSPASSGGGSKWQPKADWKSAKPSSKPSYAPAAASPRPPTARAAAPAYAPPAAAAPAYTPPAPYSPPAAAAPAYTPPAAKSDEKHIGTGGMADTRDPDALDHEDPRKSISAAPSFAEYLKSKQN